MLYTFFLFFVVKKHFFLFLLDQQFLNAKFKLTKKSVFPQNILKHFG